MEVILRLYESLNAHSSLDKDWNISVIINHPVVLVSNIGPLQNKDGELTDDPERMANILQEQYASVFSDPNSTKKCFPDFNVPLNSILENIDFSEKHIIEAINEIDAYAVWGPNDISAIVLKNCKVELALPILFLDHMRLREALWAHLKPFLGSLRLSEAIDALSKCF